METINHHPIATELMASLGSPAPCFSLFHLLIILYGRPSVFRSDHGTIALDKFKWIPTLEEPGPAWGPEDLEVNKLQELQRKVETLLEHKKNADKMLETVSKGLNETAKQLADMDSGPSVDEVKDKLVSILKILEKLEAHSIVASFQEVMRGAGGELALD